MPRRTRRPARPSGTPGVRRLGVRRLNFGAYKVAGDYQFTGGCNFGDYTFEPMTGIEWGEWDAAPEENPDDCLRSANADKTTQFSNEITPGAIKDGAMTDGSINDGDVTDGAITEGNTTFGGIASGDVTPTAGPRCPSTASTLRTRSTYEWKRARRGQVPGRSRWTTAESADR